MMPGDMPCNAPCANIFCSWNLGGVCSDNDVCPAQISHGERNDAKEAWKEVRNEKQIRNYAQKFCIFHEDRVEKHYAHACEKHPYFCDRLLPDYLLRDNIKERIALNLACARRRIKAGVHDHNLMWNEIADCEVWEATEAMFNGNTAAAVDELYDVIAVLLRTIDVLEGRQVLGKPKVAFRYM